jgi:hypothetical protein
VRQAEEKVRQIEAAYYEEGLMSAFEREEQIYRTWKEVVDKVTEQVMSHIGPFNPLAMMGGERGSRAQGTNRPVGGLARVDDDGGRHNHQRLARQEQLPRRAEHVGILCLHFLGATHFGGHGFAHFRRRLPDPPAWWMSPKMSSSKP